MQLTLARTPWQRPMSAIAVLALLIVALVATSLFIGSQRSELPAPLFRNGAIVYEQEGDLFIADQLNGTPRPLVVGSDVEFLLDPVFSPQGDRIAFVRNSATASSVMTVGTDGTEVRELAQIPGSGMQLDWAPDGDAILASNGGLWGPAGTEVVVIESDGSRSRMIETGVDGASGFAAWRPDGRHIAFVAQDGVVAVLADADGTDVGLIRSMPGRLAGLAWSPDGARLALFDVVRSTITIVDVDAGGDVTASHELASTITIVDVDAGGDVTVTHELALDPAESGVPGPSWSPDGRRLALMMRSGRVGIITADGSDYRMVGPANLTPSTGFIWSPDGRSLVITGSLLVEDPDTQINRWTEKSWSVDATTGEQTEVQTPVESWQRLAP